MAGSLNYIKGDVTQPAGAGPKVICHVVNDQGGWGAGVVLAISRRWPEPEVHYRKWAAGPDFVLGMIQPVRVASGLWVMNMLAQRGYWNGNPATPAMCYETLRTCLNKTALWTRGRGASIHCPRFGAGLAGGNWNVIEQIIKDELVGAGLSVTVYDFGG